MAPDSWECGPLWGNGSPQGALLAYLWHRITRFSTTPPALVTHQLASAAAGAQAPIDAGLAGVQ
jgi:hypothetical protein